MQKDLTEAKIFQKSFRGLRFETPCRVQQLKGNTKS